MELQQFLLFTFVTMQNSEKLRRGEHLKIDQDHADGLMLSVFVEHLLNGERLLDLFDTNKSHADGAHAEWFEMLGRFFHADPRAPEAQFTLREGNVEVEKL